MFTCIRYIQMFHISHNISTARILNPLKDHLVNLRHNHLGVDFVHQSETLPDQELGEDTRDVCGTEMDPTPHHSELDNGPVLGCSLDHINVVLIEEFPGVDDGCGSCDAEFLL